MKCPICKKQFEPKQIKKTKSGKRFCSHSCQVKYVKEKWIKAGRIAIKNRPKKIKVQNCLNCGKEYIFRICDSPNSKYCSRKCCYEYRKRMGLGKGKKCHFYIHGKGRLRDKENGYVQEWDKISLKQKAKDNYICQICDKRGGKLHVHHKDLNPKNNKINNLQTLCPRCHTKWHWEHGKSNSK